MTYALVLSDEDWAAFEEAAEIRDRAKFLARLSDVVAKELGRTATPFAQSDAGKFFRAESRWEPSPNQLRRGRALLLKEFRQAHNLTAARFAALAGKSAPQVYKDVGARRLLALSIAGRGQRIPDWQLDEIRRKLTQRLLQRARGVDAWTLYHALIEPNLDFAGKSPIEAVTAGNLERTFGTILDQLGFHG